MVAGSASGDEDTSCEAMWVRKSGSVICQPFSLCLFYVVLPSLLSKAVIPSSLVYDTLR